MGKKCAISFCMKNCPSLEIMASNLRNEITYFGLPSKFEIPNSEMYMKTWRQYGASHATYFELFSSANEYALLL